MKFARKSKAARRAETDAESSRDEAAVEETPDEGDNKAADDKVAAIADGPHDITEVDLTDGIDRIDLGGMLVAPVPGLELRLQVEEKSGEVQSVLLVGNQGAVEFRAFAAKRNDDMWSEVRGQIAADTARRGGTATEREASFGTELVCMRPVRTEDGKTGQQQSRIVGVNGPRWFLRGTFLGAPVDPDNAEMWERAIRSVVVRRGDGPMAPGEPIGLVLPPQAKRKD